MTKQRYRKLRKLFRERISAGLLEATKDEAFIFQKLNTPEADWLAFRAEMIRVFKQRGAEYKYTAPAYLLVKLKMDKIYADCKIDN